VNHDLLQEGCTQCESIAHKIGISRPEHPESVSTVDMSSVMSLLCFEGGKERSRFRR
jgi:hypothetical protein